MVLLTLRLTVVHKSVALSWLLHFGGSVDQDESKGLVAFMIRIPCEWFEISDLSFFSSGASSHLLHPAFSTSLFVYLILRREISNGLGYMYVHNYNSGSISIHPLKLRSKNLRTQVRYHYRLDGLAMCPLCGYVSNALSKDQGFDFTGTTRCEQEQLIQTPSMVRSSHTFVASHLFYYLVWRSCPMQPVPPFLLLLRSWAHRRNSTAATVTLCLVMPSVNTHLHHHHIRYNRASTPK